MFQHNLAFDDGLDQSRHAERQIDVDSVMRGCSGDIDHVIVRQYSDTAFLPV